MYKFQEDANQCNILFKNTYYMCGRNAKTGTGTINPKSGGKEKKKCLRNTASLNLIPRGFISFSKNGASTAKC